MYTLNPQDYDYRDTNTDFATLFSDWKFGGLTLHHRMVKSAAGSDTAGSEQEICAYYSNFAKGGVEMVWVEDYANVFDHYTSPRKKSKEEAHLAALAKAVHDAGGYIGYQLSCMGQSFSGFDPATAAQYESAYAEHLNEEEIKNLKSDFINGAIYLKEQGFDAVETTRLATISVRPSFPASEIIVKMNTDRSRLKPAARFCQVRSSPGSRKPAVLVSRSRF